MKDSQDPAIPGKITDHGKGKYSVSVTALGPGLHELHITIANCHIKGSPFDFHVASPRESAYTELRAQQPFTTNLKPYDVAVTKEGQFAVAEFGSHTVSLYSTTGEKIHTFGNINHAGTADTQFNSPAAVAISGDLMYVCDQGNSRVLKFNISKKSFLSKFEVKGKGDKQVSSHCGICVDPEGKVFITDYSNNSIQVFRADDRFAYSFDCESHPLGIAFDPQGLLHVVTQSSCSVHVFTPEGTPVTSYGTGGNPAGIAINVEGYVAISQWKRGGSLWIYGPWPNKSLDPTQKTPGYTLVHTLPRQFSFGRGIACDKEGSFWVANSNNKRIEKF